MQFEVLGPGGFEDAPHEQDAIDCERLALDRCVHPRGLLSGSVAAERQVGQEPVRRVVPRGPGEASGKATVKFEQGGGGVGLGCHEAWAPAQREGEESLGLQREGPDWLAGGFYMLDGRIEAVWRGGSDELEGHVHLLGRNLPHPTLNPRTPLFLQCHDDRRRRIDRNEQPERHGRAAHPGSSSAMARMSRPR